jgi:NADH:ubiquinone oxidoreductase subunit
MSIMNEVFVWWDGQTLSTRIQTMLSGEKVGSDDGGNTYYLSKKNTKRWVVYKGSNDASKIPSEWHLWLHYTTDERPASNYSKKYIWQKKHKENMTGTNESYYPIGSLRSKKSNNIIKSYESWKP